MIDLLKFTLGGMSALCSGLRRLGGDGETVQDGSFEKFAQGAVGRARDQGGSGMGVDLLRAVVERRGRTMGFPHDLEAGTPFHFDLPEWRAEFDPVERA